MESVPFDIWRKIYLLLEIDEIRQCFRVCKKFNHATENAVFLKRLAIRLNVDCVTNGNDVLLIKECIRRFKNCDNSTISLDRLELDRICLVSNDPHLQYASKFGDTPMRKLRIFLPVVQLMIHQSYFSFYYDQITTKCKVNIDEKSFNILEDVENHVKKITNRELNSVLVYRDRYFEGPYFKIDFKGYDRSNVPMNKDVSVSVMIRIEFLKTKCSITSCNPVIVQTKSV